MLIKNDPHVLAGHIRNAVVSIRSSLKAIPFTAPEVLHERYDVIGEACDALDAVAVAVLTPPMTAEQKLEILLAAAASSTVDQALSVITRGREAERLVDAAKDALGCADIPF